METQPEHLIHTVMDRAGVLEHCHTIHNLCEIAQLIPTNREELMPTIIELIMQESLDMWPYCEAGEAVIKASLTDVRDP